MNIEKDFWGYDVITTGVDTGRYATAEVAAQSHVDELYSYISDASKDAQGFRVRFEYQDWSFAELEAECDYWSEQVAIAVERERQQEEKDLAKFKALIQHTIELGAGDEETALRWLTQGEQFYHSQDVEHWVWQQGILFTDYGRELINKLENVISYKKVA